MEVTVLIITLICWPKARDRSRDGPLEKLWGEEGNFRAAGIFFRYSLYEFFSGPCMNIS